VKEAIQPEGLVRPAAPYSQVVVSGDLVYTAGQAGSTSPGS
jgi:enamine deaminase RidA (YjgF/YER057c/UK114 family)